MLTMGWFWLDILGRLHHRQLRGRGGLRHCVSQADALSRVESPALVAAARSNFWWPILRPRGSLLLALSGLPCSFMMPITLAQFEQTAAKPQAMPVRGESK